MGKYASRDGSSSVAWADITGKPATFTPAVHSNTAHSTAYAPLATPTFTGGQILITNGAQTSYWQQSGTECILHNGYGPLNMEAAGDIIFKTYRGGGYQSDFKIDYTTGNAFAAKGLHVGAMSGDPGDNNIVADGNITGASLNTPNWTIDEDGSNNGIIKYQGTAVGRVMVPIAGKSDLLMTGGIGCYQAL